MPVRLASVNPKHKHFHAPSLCMNVTNRNHMHGPRESGKLMVSVSVQLGTPNRSGVMAERGILGCIRSATSSVVDGEYSLILQSGALRPQRLPQNLAHRHCLVCDRHNRRRDTPCPLPAAQGKRIKTQAVTAGKYIRYRATVKETSWAIPRPVCLSYCKGASTVARRALAAGKNAPPPLSNASSKKGVSPFGLTPIHLYATS